MITRLEALAAAVEALPDAAFVVTCGATSREMAAVFDRPGNLYLLDSMGLTTSVALGLGIGLQERGTRVVAIDGDGSLLMNLGSLASIGAAQPPNLTVLLLDNGEHASANGVPTTSGVLDLVRVAEGCGLRAAECTTEEELFRQLREVDVDGPRLLRVRIARGNREGTPWLRTDPVVIAERFGSWLAQTDGRRTMALAHGAEG